MKVRLIVLIVLALVMAGGTVVFVQSYLKGLKKPDVVQTKDPSANIAHVLVAKKTMPAGSFVKAGDLRWQSWPDASIPKSYLVRGTITEAQLYGSVVRYGAVAGQPITREFIVKPGDRGFLAAVLRPGMRAIAVPVNATTGIAGLVFPGDRVDLILTHRITIGTTDEDRRTQQIGETVLTDIRILAIDQKTNDVKNKPSVAKTVTLELSPKHVEMVMIAQRVGRLSLSLRSLARDSQDDNDLVLTKTDDTKDVSMKEKTGIKAGTTAANTKDSGDSTDSMKRPLPKRGKTYTRDTAVSHVLKGNNSGTRVEIVRGSNTARVSVNPNGSLNVTRGGTATKIVTPGQAGKVIPGALTGKK